ncbi:bifunctional adenosylcobinamide kinase/adenosylcobinamide-phosphate guanylyltransferase [Lysinibacillus sp. SGAir0095]|uniref:bifunctional adenosylcobinamide kinase/adenosylcobinamide-phosphate guanylyltransferase n=1 Tax=Lysinibacillus sp. SGAir0095 TaxID=2070463 RepID=UPI0010CD687A|nr:bifunctional adenosylcobinamide kinase/adenosylcobinamide-phosphate guanylyltransferase [Lysinibacillus sp. SGAir0095]QCR32893.1 adenosylcobinamide kinase [Lysinibacillus sp. SGAir0095]
MQVVIGGAYNGKRKYIKEKLLNRLAGKLYFFEGEIPKKKLLLKEDIVVIGSFEKIILQKVHLEEDVIAQEIIKELIELDKQAKVICVCTDIGRGVVPILKEERKLRDACGRLYQKLFNESEDVIRIWYGIPQILKGEGL